MALYQGIHRSQFDGTPLAKQNCSPTSAADGARCATGGSIDKSGGQVRALVEKWEETSPETPGWSMTDIDLAMYRLKVPFVKGDGGWAGVRAARAKKQFVVLQGDSEEFPNGTCSGVFDGDHCTGIHPDTIRDEGIEYWRLGDPICKNWRWESEATLRRYASNFRETISFGVFTTPVPELKPPTQPVPTGWVRVQGTFWQYAVSGNPTKGYAISRVQKTTKGFSANVGTMVDTNWGGRDRVFAKVISGAYADTWVDTLDEGQVRLFDLAA